MCFNAKTQSRRDARDGASSKDSEKKFVKSDSGTLSGFLRKTLERVFLSLLPDAHLAEDEVLMRVPTRLRRARGATYP